jgi:hypothetical protein
MWPPGADRPRRRAATALAALALLALTAPPAAANVRAPRRTPGMPSSAAGPPAGDPKATVLRETLSFRCQGTTCRVTARYTVDADRAAPVTLDFMLPVAAAVTARAGNAPAAVAVATADPAAADLDRRLKLRDHYLVPDDQPLPPLFRATVALPLSAGRNELTFEYDQPLAALERGHGYFKKGRLVSELYYLLWPLKEWTRAPDFAIELALEIDRSPPSWWQRTFGHPTDVSCGPQVPGTRAQVGGQLLFRARLGAQFPDVLTCQIGEDDLL